MPLDADVALELLAARTGGLSAADLAQLCVQAALCALHRGHAAGGIETVSVSRDDFERALETARPSAAGFETAPDPTRGGGLAAHENRALTTGGGNKPK
jgi:SpoVK/Ycf46/Vps4 family AAA+-type ATPase